MSGRIVYRPSDAELHAREGCGVMPDPADFPRGTRWQCDDCNRQYVVVTGSQFNEPYTTWRPLTDANREGYDR